MYQKMLLHPKLYRWFAFFVFMTLNIIKWNFWSKKMHTRYTYKYVSHTFSTTVFAMGEFQSINLSIIARGFFLKIRSKWKKIRFSIPVKTRCLRRPMLCLCYLSNAIHLLFSLNSTLKFRANLQRITMSLHIIYGTVVSFSGSISRHTPLGLST